jgi:hypothetical protein
VKKIFTEVENPIVNREEIARAPVEAIQRVIKKSQEDAKKLLAENEEKAKREIDLIVAIKKDFDDLAAKGKKDA